MKKSRKDRIAERIEAAGYERIPGGFGNLLCAFYEDHRWWVYVYDKCVVWSVESPDFLDPKGPLYFKKLPPQRQREGLHRL